MNRKQRRKIFEEERQILCRKHGVKQGCAMHDAARLDPNQKGPFFKASGRIDKSR